MTAIVPQLTVAGALADPTILGIVKFPAAPLKLSAHFNFLYGSGGTTFDAYLQTSFDGGNNWCDIANLHATTSPMRRVVNLSGLTPVTTPATPTDGSITANTSLDGVLGDQFRVRAKSTGTYAGATSIEIHLHADKK